MTHGSLFSGVGGFDLAAEWMGWDNIFHCEWNPFGQKVLKHYWPNSISYEDICTTDFTKHRGEIDIISGGFPCQPFSSAGKRQGTDDSRYLWPEMLRCIREVRPRWIVGENVLGLVNWNEGLVLDTVCADLENEGFKILPVVLPAASVNAPHKRDRIWFIAYSINGGYSTNRGKVTEENRIQSLCRQAMEPREFNRTDISWDVANSSNERLQGSEINGGFNQFRQERKKLSARFLPSDFKEFPTVSPLCNGDDGLSNRLDSITFSKWRRESIKAGGNAIVPQVVLQIFKTIEEYETNRRTS